MSKPFHFTAVIQDAGNGGAYVTVPFDVEAACGKKRVRVRATIAGQLYRGWMTRMGSEGHILIVLKEISEKARVTFGLDRGCETSANPSNEDRTNDRLAENGEERPLRLRGVFLFGYPVFH